MDLIFQLAAMGQQGAIDFLEKRLDCVTRAIAIVTQQPYSKVKADLLERCQKSEGVQSFNRSVRIAAREGSFPLTITKGTVLLPVCPGTSTVTT